jgi:hypothetical protein
MNAGEIISFSFATHLIGWVFFAPGDFILLETMLHATRSALFLNLASKDLPGFLSGVLSLLSWSGILMLRLKYSGKSKYSIT